MTDNKGAGRRNKGKRTGADGVLGSNSEIGRKLKQYYDELVSDEIPDRFMHLLSQLEQKEASKSATEKE
ncbi:hypothetical protein L598_000200002010 [Mesorhizobium sp. J18]|uniref:NepR family anti-sigma factor n=1 Tax=Mesorhizobium sp. J18 TaxID=935263 RepID=UPI00119BBB57|nr:NepR family anti-sigma factor [Mesorhizobium sp. J18]TWG98062.1 hypothetical protein L598_000200002010 [Mesorhizobium sp. J18]